MVGPPSAEAAQQPGGLGASRDHEGLLQACLAAKHSLQDLVQVAGKPAVGRGPGGKQAGTASAQQSPNGAI